MWYALFCLFFPQTHQGCANKALFANSSRTDERTSFICSRTCCSRTDALLFANKCSFVLFANTRKFSLKLFDKFACEICFLKPTKLTTRPKFLKRALFANRSRTNERTALICSRTRCPRTNPLLFVNVRSRTVRTVLKHTL